MKPERPSDSAKGPRPLTAADFRPQTTADLSDMALAYRASQLTDAFKHRLPTASELRNITEELGVEIATAVYLRTLQESGIHGEFARKIQSFDFQAWDQNTARAAQIEVCIVASNLFQSGRKWGDHVDEWRQWARDLGFTTDVIETDAKASVAANARVIIEHFARSPNRKRILITYGQGASEFRYLLHRRVNRTEGEAVPEELAQVRGWINVCGAFAGASSSRYFQENRLRRLLTRLRMKVAGRNPLTLAETSASFPVWRRPLPMPPNLLITSLVGVPQKSQMSGTPYLYLYSELAKTMPNDGVVSVVEASAHPGLLYAVPGMSHRAERTKLEPVFKRTLGVLGQALGVTSGAVGDEKLSFEIETLRKR